MREPVFQIEEVNDPVEIARRYDEQGADEITFLDITATSDGRDLILHIIEAVASQVFIPLTVGGGVRAVEDVRRLLNAGADKISVNSAAVANPQLVNELQRDRQAVMRDVRLLESFGLLKTREAPNPGHGTQRIVARLAARYQLVANI